MKMKPFGWCVVLVATLVMSLSAGRVAAQNMYFRETSGYWTNSAHWDPVGVPGSASNAWIGTSRVRG